jgi:uncharacterized membrane protein
MSKTRPERTRFIDRLKAQFLIGIVVAVPLGATILILIWIFDAVDGILRPVVTLITKHNIPGVGFVGTIVLIYIAGVIGSSLVGKRVLLFSEGIVGRVPLVRSIYTLIKQILEGFSDPRGAGFMKVVLIEYPMKGIMSIAFVTNEYPDDAGNTLYNVFIPGSPNPTSGFLRIMKASDITQTTLSVDEALKMIVSFGRVAPEGAAEKLSQK